MSDHPEPKDKRIPIMMSDSEVEAIDSWRFQNRIATRSEAIRRLCQIGLLVDVLLPEGERYRSAVSESILTATSAANSLIDLRNFLKGSDKSRSDKLNEDIERLATILEAASNLHNFTHDLHGKTAIIKDADFDEDAHSSSQKKLSELARQLRERWHERVPATSKKPKD